MKKRYPWEIQCTHNLIAESEDGGERNTNWKITVNLIIIDMKSAKKMSGKWKNLQKILK